MLSRQIDLASLETRRTENSRDDRNAENYKEVTRRSALAKELQKGSLKALKKLLASAKAESDSSHTVSAAGPFSEMSIAQVTAQRGSIDKIDPSAQVMQLYSKLIDKLVYIAKEGIQKTIFYLDTTAFDSSILRGAKITITEFSTAPRIFNIHFSADPKAVAFFEAHAAGLQNALNNGGHKFDVNRIDSSLLTEDEKHALEPVQPDPEDDNDA